MALFDPWRSFFLGEGKEDESYRNRAIAVVEKIQKKLASATPQAWNQRTASYTLSGILDDVPGVESARLLMLFILLPLGKEKDQGAGVRVQKDGRLVTIEMRFASDEEKDEELKKDWVEHTKENSSFWLKKYKEVLVHEVIHLFDRARIPPQAFRKQVAMANKGGTADYYNNPTELNAFAQQGMAKFVEKLKSVKSLDAAKMVMGKTPQEFFQKLERNYWDPDFVKNITPANRRKLQKRSYTLWGDILRSLSQSKRN